MDFNEYVAGLMKASRDETLGSSPQIRLGDLIAQLEKAGVTNEDGMPKDCRFDFGSALPSGVSSWRGSYAELAIEYTLSGYDSNGGKGLNAVEFLNVLKGAVGNTYTGWKGGDFTMTVNTPLWVSNPGNADYCGVIGVLDRGWYIIILTGYCEF